MQALQRVSYSRPMSSEDDQQVDTQQEEDDQEQVEQTEHDDNDQQNEHQQPNDNNPTNPPSQPPQPNQPPPAAPTEEELGRQAEAAAAAEEAREQAEQRAAQQAEAAREAVAAKLVADMARRRRVDAEELQLVEAASAPLRAWLLANVMPALIDGLQQTAKERPEDPVDFLATFLYKYAVGSGDLERSKAQAADSTAISSITAA